MWKYSSICKKCILLTHHQKTRHFPGILNVLSGMPWSNKQGDHCLLGSVWASEHAESSFTVHVEHTCSSWLGNCLKKTEVKQGCSCCQNSFTWLRVFLTSPQHGVWNIWSRLRAAWTSFTDQLCVACWGYMSWSTVYSGDVCKISQ